MSTKIKLIILSIAFVLCVTIGGTFAFSPSSTSSIKSMKIANVSMRQLEYERVRDEQGNLVSSNLKDEYGNVPDKLQKVTQEKEIIPAHYKEGIIKMDDRNGKDEYRQSWKEINAPGANQLYDDSIKNIIDKFIFVENTGTTNIYYRTIIAIECPIGVDESIIHVNLNLDESIYWQRLGYANIRKSRFVVLVATYKTALMPGKISKPSLLQVFLDPSTSSKDMEAYNNTFEILVETQSVEAISNIESSKALNEQYGKVIENLPWK